MLNKVDLLTAEERKALREKVLALYNKRVLEISTVTGEGMAEWYHILETEVSAPQQLMEMDYEEYAEGEAMLDWLNATLALNAIASRWMAISCCCSGRGASSRSWKQPGWR